MSGNKPYTIEYEPEVLSDDLPSLSTSAKALIKRAIESRLKANPVLYGKPLRHSLSGHRRLRVSDYRVVYFIEAARHVVVVTAIKHRSKVYE